MPSKESKRLGTDHGQEVVHGGIGPVDVERPNTPPPPASGVQPAKPKK